jgi:hypothetical protein
MILAADVPRKYGDARVGTNSPFSINHKRDGKRKAWLQWLLLIFTSLPVHFLANSIIGPSLVYTPPQTVSYNETSYSDFRRQGIYHGYLNSQDYDSIICWSALRTGQSRYPVAGVGPSSRYASMYKTGLGSDFVSTNWGHILVSYARENCSSFVNNTDILHAQVEYDHEYDWDLRYEVGGCRMRGSYGESSGATATCVLSEPTPTQCRLNIRMQAAFILGGCLVIKAIYMVTVNLLARGKVKKQCLTFGDVIVASATDPELRIKGECMVNAAESYRRYISPYLLACIRLPANTSTPIRQTTHACHKHCTADPSTTGDEIGHCQNCKKFNVVDKFVPLVQPTIVRLLSRSLIFSTYTSNRLPKSRNL